MAGETSLRTLLRTLTPELNPGDYVFCTCADGALPNGAEPLASFREREGLTLVLNAGRPNAWACPTNTWRPGSP